MSGPMAASFGLEAAVLVSAQSIINGAAEIAAGLSAAEQAAQQLRQQRRAERRQLRAVQAARLAAGLAQQQQASAQAETLSQLSRLLADASDDDPAATITAAAASRADALAAGAGSLASQLAAYIATRAAQAGSAPSSAPGTARRLAVARILERLDSDAAELPPALLTLAQAIIDAASEIRAEALATELRYQVQRHNEQLAAQLAAEHEQQQRQEAAALVLEQSLKDLGYAVEDIDETLFIEGGIAHFQRADWGDYFIRLRIDQQRNAMNFNVVRTGTAGEDRQHEDMLAEERWCSEFPKLFDTLKARGIPITVKRLLQAGEAPVQVVDAASLPTRTAEAPRHAPLKARSRS